MITNLLHVLQEILLPKPGGPASEIAERWIRVNGSPRQNGYF